MVSVFSAGVLQSFRPRRLDPETNMHLLDAPQSSLSAAADDTEFLRWLKHDFRPIAGGWQY